MNASRGDALVRFGRLTFAVPSLVEMGRDHRTRRRNARVPVGLSAHPAKANAKRVEGPLIAVGASATMETQTSALGGCGLRNWRVVPAASGRQDTRDHKLPCRTTSSAPLPRVFESQAFILNALCRRQLRIPPGRWPSRPAAEPASASRMCASRPRVARTADPARTIHVLLARAEWVIPFRGEERPGNGRISFLDRIVIA